MNHKANGVARPNREKVLILRGEGDTGPWMEVYGPKYLDVHVRAVPHIASRSGEELALDFVEATLKRPYRDLYWPGNLRWQGVVETVKPSDIIDAYYHRQLIRDLDTVCRNPEQRRAG